MDTINNKEKTENPTEAENTVNTTENPREKDTEDNTAAEETSTAEETAKEEEMPQEEETVEEKLARAEARIAELEKERLYKQAEFDNFRKRIVKEKAELILNGGRKVLEAMLPVVDDLERALQHMQTAEDVDAVKEGVDLIYKKFLRVLEAQGVTQMKTEGADFNTDFHEAVTQFPAPTEELKGKVIDCTEKGYMLNDSVLRFAKVVVGI